MRPAARAAVQEMQPIATPIAPLATPLMVTVPPGVAPGSVIAVNTPSGQMQVTVPAGVTEGAQFQILLGAPPSGSPDDALAMFAGTQGFEIKGMRASEHDMSNDWDYLTKAFAVQSTWQNPFGIATATRGAFAVKSIAEDSSPIGELYVACRDRFKGDLAAAVLKPDKTVVAQFGRTARPTLLQSGDTVVPVTIFGSPYGHLETSTWGNGHTYVDASGRRVKVVSRGCNQPKMWYVCASFCLFFPTCAIGSCIMFYYAGKTPNLFDLKTEPEGPNAGVLKMWEISTDFSSTSSVRVEFDESADSKTKLAATLASLFFAADSYTNPPSSNGGGGGGAPDNAVMER